MNLTAVRDPEQIITRHFGESLFAAQQLFHRPSAPLAPGDCTENAEPLKHHAQRQDLSSITLADVGSGAGFPGVPIKLFAPDLRLVLVESQAKKAMFLRELIRALELQNAEVFIGRAEQWNHTADAVTLRAVEKFEQVLPVTARLVSAGGRVCLLIGESQASTAASLLPDVNWQTPVPIPLSSGRVVLLGSTAA